MYTIELPIENPVLVFAIAMIIILLAPMAFQRIRVPGIVGIIVTGALIGPSALGLLERSETFILLGTVGLIYLMFTAGITLDLNQFTRHRNRSIVFGLLSFTIPAGLAAGVFGVLLGYSTAQGLLAAAIVGSHTLLAYPVVQRLGILRNAAVTMTMGGTMVTDVVSLTLLAVVVAVTEGSISVSFWISFLGLSAVYVAAVLLIVPRLGDWFFRTVRKQPDVEFVFLMVLLFSGAFLAEYVGLAHIIGAFLVGLVVNRLVPGHSPLMTRISFIGDALFVPFFLLSVGLLVDLRIVFSSIELWALTLQLTLIVVVGKTSASFISKKIFGLSKDEAWVSSGLSIPQAAATLAVTLLGFEIGLLDGLFVNAVVVMILLSCLLGPWLVDRFGRRVALEADRQPYEPSEAPQRILVPLANPETADELMQIAMMIRDRSSHEPIYPLTVTRDSVTDVAPQVAAAEKLLSHAVVYAAAADVPVTPITRIDHNVAAGIVRAMREQRISTVVIGWNGEYTASAYIFGSILDQLLEESRQMVIVSKVDTPVNVTKRLIVVVPPYADVEPGFHEAVSVLKVFADQGGADIVIITTKPEKPRIMRQYESVKPEVNTTFVDLNSWGALSSALEENVEEDDLIVLMNVREGSIAWQSSLDRLPRLIAQRFPATNFITQYLPEPVGDRSSGRNLINDRRSSVSLQSMLVDADIVTGIENTDVDPISYLLVSTHDDDTDLELLQQEIFANPDANLRLRPGVIFYRLHSPSVKTGRLIFGLSREGVTLEGAAKPVHLIVILLVPQAVGAGEYLRRLSIVAQMIPPTVELDKLKSMETDDEAVAHLKEHMEVSWAKASSGYRR